MVGSGEARPLQRRTASDAGAWLSAGLRGSRSCSVRVRATPGVECWRQLTMSYYCVMCGVAAGRLAPLVFRRPCIMHACLLAADRSLVLA